MDIKQVREKIADYLRIKGVYELLAPENDQEMELTCMVVADKILSIEIGGEVEEECPFCRNISPFVGKDQGAECICKDTGKITRPVH